MTGYSKDKESIKIYFLNSELIILNSEFLIVFLCCVSMKIIIYTRGRDNLFSRQTRSSPIAQLVRALH